MDDEIKEMKTPSDVQPLPEITPHMIQSTFTALDAKGLTQYAEGGVYIPTERGWQLLKKSGQREEITAYGHPNVTSTHTTTLEITKAAEIDKEADCIIAVRADKACADLSEDFKNELKSARKILITIQAGRASDTIVAYGSPALRLSHKEDIVIRKSDFIDNRTLAILADKAANELDQDLVDELKKGDTKVKIILEIK